MIKTGILLNCRLGSTRFPKKHLIRTEEGLTLIEHLVLRILHHFQQDIKSKELQIIINTSCRKINLEFDKIFENYPHVEVFHGNDENIPYRQLRCSEQFNLESIISVCADNFLISMNAISSVHDHLRAGRQIVKTVGLPLGMNVAGYSYDALKECLDGKPENTRMETGWYAVFEKKMAEIKMGEHDLYGNLRLTLDYPEDSKFVKTVISILGDQFHQASDQQILDVIHQHDLTHLNGFLNQKYWENFHQKTDKI